MATLVEAADKGRGKFRLPLRVFAGCCTTIARRQSHPHIPHSSPAGFAFDDKPEWNDRTVLVVISVVSVFASLMWMGFGIALWWILAA
jgi:hypothetical protein